MTNFIPYAERPSGIKAIPWRVVFPGIVILIVILGYGAWRFDARALFGGKSGSSHIDTHGWQAVFLTNNQVYFGKLSITPEFYILSDVFYLQSKESPSQDVNQAGQNSQTSQPVTELVKLGNELHGPQGVMYIERSQALFWENLKEDSQVISSIKRYEELR